MQIFIQTDEKELLQDSLSFSDTAVALGCFDAMHLGHRAIIKDVVDTAKEKGLKSLVYFFINTPRSVISNTDTPQINTLEERLSILDELGVDVAVARRATPDFLNISAEEFAENILADKLGAKYICAGFNYRFGKGGLGDIDYLIDLGKELGIVVKSIPCVKLNGDAVSSSRIKELLLSGKIEDANACLGRTFSVSGKVVSGNHIGRTIGFPTVNLEIPKGKLYPSFGVYISRVKVDEKSYPSITNIGTRPTVDDGTFIESHLLDFSGDLYDKEITVEFYSHLRDIEKFENLDDLKDQLEKDKLSAKRFFEK